MLAVAGVGLLVWIGVQPPNDPALTATLGACALLAAGWWLGVRKVFRGPPVTSFAENESAPAASAVTG